VSQPASDANLKLPQLDDDQMGVLASLLDLERRVTHSEFESVWRYAVALDFRLEAEPEGPLRKALGR
jgi:hypothetical protein